MNQRILAYPGCEFVHRLMKPCIQCFDPNHVSLKTFRNEHIVSCHYPAFTYSLGTLVRVRTITVHAILMTKLASGCQHNAPCNWCLAWPSGSCDFAVKANVKALGHLRGDQVTWWPFQSKQLAMIYWIYYVICEVTVRMSCVLQQSLTVS